MSKPTGLNSTVLARFIPGASLVVAYIVVSLLALEGGARVLDKVPLTTTRNFVAKELGMAWDQSSLGIYNPRLGWSLRPNFHSPSLQFTTGEFGIRMPSSTSSYTGTDSDLSFSGSVDPSLIGTPGRALPQQFSS